MLAFTMSKLPGGYRGRASGIWTSMFFIGQFVCPLWVAAVSTLGGGTIAAMAFFAGFIAVGGLLLLTGLVLQSLPVRIGREHPLADRGRRRFADCAGD
ncbi:hypothetical protein NHF53_15955 [Ciceribacter sp. RN22]|nr:hypothetical protein [Ciceribacter sp. RN22]